MPSIIEDDFDGALANRKLCCGRAIYSAFIAEYVMYCVLFILHDESTENTAIKMTNGSM